MWQKAKSGRLHYTDDEWYEERRVGHNPLESFMKNLAEEANLEGKTKYTNHSIRATCIRNLDKSGFEARHITAVSGHKNESTIREYSVKCPDNKKKEMFVALSKHVNPQVKVESTEPKQKNFNFTIPSLPENEASQLPTFNLFEMDDQDDQLFYRILTETENSLALNTHPLPKANTPPAPQENTTENTQVYTQTEQTVPIHNPTPTPNPTPQPVPNQNPTPLPLATVPQNTVTNVQHNTYPALMPVVPKMLFSHSNVTVNYNIHTGNK